MKTKLLAALLTVCLMLTMHAFALAAGNEAIVNGVPYTDFMAAVAAANGTSYPVEVYGTLTVTGDFPNGVKVKVIGKTADATLDLGDTPHVAQNGGILEFEDIKLVKPYNNSNYMGFHHAAKESYKNCTIEGEYWTYGLETTFTGCTFIQTNPNRYNIWTYGALNCTITDCTFKFASKSILFYNESKTNNFNLTVEDCEFITENYVASDKAAVEIDSSESTTGSYTLNLSNNKVDCLLSGNGEEGMYRHKKGSKLTVSESGSELTHNYDQCGHEPPATPTPTPTATPTPVPVVTATPAPAAPVAPVAPTATPAPAPKTGDSTPIAMLTVVLMASAAAMVWMVANKRKANQQ